ncbi:hypothetical protein NDR87_16040 [Nocardia sp. CDC159]|uniref:Polyhydroxybutyrate depolymerase n=1 Tax=Nocardia pulmonis TaxID=2951408 RepID=A0A9X2E9N1_9NOCA|nr:MULTISPECIES: PHB depolymerase family esterase [Nocardia]MCM6775395.1 hypothetical protein [Nocardia pulmonis]MCM6787871.1 hypothetical protein [Nocardia sp. CDC159]
MIRTHHIRGRAALVVASLLLLLGLTGPSAWAEPQTDQPPPEQPSAACAQTPTSGTIQRTIGDRVYLLRVPAGLPNPAPLLLALHGGGSGPGVHESQSGWSGFADAKKFIVAYPRGGLANDNGTWSWHYLPGQNQDEQFLRAVIDDISGKWCVDSRRIHVSGHSNGGQMTTRMACSAADLIASAAVYAGPAHSVNPYDCAISRPISFGLFAGQKDPIVNLALMVTHRLNWQIRNGCTSPPVSEPRPDGVVAAEVNTCNAGTKVVWRVYDAGHGIPGGALGADIRNRMWTMFQNNPRP